MSNTFSEVVLEKGHDESRQGEALVIPQEIENTASKKVYLESYGCAMNFSDSEIVASIMANLGYQTTPNMEEANVIFVNTCSIRDNAEKTVRARLNMYRKIKRNKPGTVIGVLGCMAERLKAQLLDEEKLVDMVIGPDAYKDLPNLLMKVEDGEKSVNVLLSREETYADIVPVRLSGNGIFAFVTIMRGCDNMCSFCVVPFTRGRERSRDVNSILSEVRDLSSKGYKEITLLGQNVDSYKWTNPEDNSIVSFANLLELCALVDTTMRIRFSTSHPKDITDEVLYTIAKYNNICKYIHLPVQHGNSEMLKKMNRTYNREWYLDRVAAIRRIIPECAISSDIIAGFCGETEEQHKETISIVLASQYTFSYIYAYSERPGTLAARKFEDDIPEADKKRRLAEINDVSREVSHELNKLDIGKTYEILIEGFSKKSDKDLAGRTSQNKMVILPVSEGIKIGDYVTVKITDCTSATLFGKQISA